MPVIRVDREVYDAIRRRAEPLVDTPNTVLRRVFDLPQKARKARTRTARYVPNGKDKEKL